MLTFIQCILWCRNDSGIRGVQFVIQSTAKVKTERYFVLCFNYFTLSNLFPLCAWQDPGHIDLRIEAFLKMFESKLYDMTNDEFKVDNDLYVYELCYLFEFVCTIVTSSDILAQTWLNLRNGKKGIQTIINWPSRLTLHLQLTWEN